MNIVRNRIARPDLLAEFIALRISYLHPGIPVVLSESTDTATHVHVDFGDDNLRLRNLRYAMMAPVTDALRGALDAWHMGAAIDELEAAYEELGEPVRF